MAEHKDVRRRQNNTSKVNRIVSLFEIPRPSKHRGLQRTNSLPASRRTRFSTGEEDEKTTPSKGIFSTLYNQAGRVKKIKEELEQKNKTEDHKEENTAFKKTPRFRRKKTNSESRMTESVDEEKERIMQNLMNISHRVGKIQIVTEDIEDSDTEVEITVADGTEENDDVFETHEEIVLKDPSSTNDININEAEVDDSDSVEEEQDSEGDDKTDGYGKYDLTTGTAVFSRNCSIESDSSGQQDNTEVESDNDFPKDENKQMENIQENGSPDNWVSRLYKKEYDPGTVENGHYYKETDEEETSEGQGPSELDSLSEWSHKTFVQINNEEKIIKKQYSEDKSDDVWTDESGSSSRASAVKEKNRFIKHQTGRQSIRRRTGILSKAQTVRDLAQKFEGFKEAAEKGETEYYRRSFIDEMDKQLEEMKKDGFEDEFHLSLDNLSIVEQGWTDDDERDKSSGDNKEEDEDLFGETLFSEDLEHGLCYVESFNADGKELIVCNVQVERKSVDINSLDEVRGQLQSSVLAQQDDEKTLILMGELEQSQLSSSDSNNGTDSKRTTIYSTTSGESFDDRITDDEGIDIENSSNLYKKYSSARRETYCDDQGIIRIERVAPYTENVQNVSENTSFGEEDDHEPFLSSSEVKKERLQYILEEIIVTERKYVEDMREILREYKPFLMKRCPERVEVVFGNMEYILVKQIKFLEDLENCDNDVRNVVQAFIDFKDLFKLYPRYFKNTPKANAAVKDLSEIIKEKQEQLNDKLHLSAYLLTPLQRLGKYKLFLENITKQFLKEGKPTGAVEMALEIVKKYMRRGNDAVAVASILYSPLHLKDYGGFVTREKFMMIKPKRMEMMVFLFEEVVIFTIEDSRNMEQFIYWQSIKTNDLRIATFDDTTIHLTDYTKTKRRNSSKYTFVLDARNQKLKITWKQEIEEILWRQLKKVKENTLKEYQSGQKTPKLFGRSRVKSTGASVFYTE